jgi:hypothetical protein
MHYTQTIQHINTMRSIIMVAQVLFLGCFGIAFLSIIIRIVRKIGKISTKATGKSPWSDRNQVIDAVCYDTLERHSTQDDDDLMIVDQFGM